MLYLALELRVTLSLHIAGSRLGWKAHAWDRERHLLLEQARFLQGAVLLDGGHQVEILHLKDNDDSHVVQQESANLDYRFDRPHEVPHELYAAVEFR